MWPWVEVVKLVLGVKHKKNMVWFIFDNMAMRSSAPITQPDGNLSNILNDFEEMFAMYESFYLQILPFIRCWE